MEQIQLPSGWEWQTDWTPIRNRNFDSSGFQYGKNINLPFTEKCTMSSNIRRQQWGRKMRFSKRFAPVVLGR